MLFFELGTKYTFVGFISLLILSILYNVLSILILIPILGFIRNLICLLFIFSFTYFFITDIPFLFCYRFSGLFLLYFYYFSAFQFFTLNSRRERWFVSNTDISSTFPKIYFIYHRHYIIAFV